MNVHVPAPLTLPAILSLALSAALMPPAAAAADVELTPTVSYRAEGYSLRQDLVCITIYEECRLRADGEDGPAFGLILGVGLAPDWQLELLANRQESEPEARVDLIAPPGTRIPDLRVTEDLDFKATHVQIGVSRTWGDGGVRPFVGGAVGASRVEITGPKPPGPTFAPPFFQIEDRSEDTLSGSLGAGVKLYLSPRIGVRLEARGYWVDLGEDAGGDFTQAEAAAGLILRF
ncbi:MAG: outer membrane protein [Thermoanaerobaculia bacterium]